MIKIQHIKLFRVVKSKITKIPNSKQNANRNVPYQMAISKTRTHQTNGKQMSYNCLGTCIF